MKQAPLGVLLITALAAEAQNATTTPGSGPTPTAACGHVSSIWQAQGGVSATATPVAPAPLVYECLNSVPLAKQAALKFIDELEPYLEWQSSTAFLKNPPSDYFYPAYDLFGELARIRASIENDEYANEYAWQADLYVSVFGNAHDGHLVVYPDLLTKASEWARPWALVSISEDGSSLPVVKVYEDVIASPETASIVKEINGEDAVKYISDWIFKASGNQDKDAAYNSMFYSKAYEAELGSQGYFKSGGRVRYVFPGNTTTMTFENGTTIEFENLARLKDNWVGVTDGSSFFEQFCEAGAAVPTTTVPTSTTSPGFAPTSSSVSTSATSTTSTSSTAAVTPTAVPGYPKPVIVSSDSIVSGYFIDEPGFEDVAVLAMLSFYPEDPSEFQRVVQDFFAAAVAAGKTKLVVDVSVNGGGYIFQGYDTFRQIFPDIVQQGLGRWRHSSGLSAISQVFSQRCADYDPLTAPAELIYECESTFNWRYDLDEELKDFTSYEDKFGPVSFNNDSYTNLMQWNFDNPLDTINSTFGIGYDVTGYRSRTNFTRPFGGPENVVVLLDGYCASTCTIFSQFMKWNAGVKGIALGGRPQKGLIQGVGGVKGSQSYGFADVYSQAMDALDKADDAALKKELSRYTTYVIERSSAAGLNVKDEILAQNIEDGTPSHFVAEYSDCRLYFTPAMMSDQNAVWKAAASAAFKGGKCNDGAIEYNTTATTYGSAKRTARPAPFNKPRFTIPKNYLPLTKGRPAIDRRTPGLERSTNVKNPATWMKVID